MNWIISSILMYVSSVGLYLFIRKSSKLRNPSQYNNLAMFLVPLIVFLFVGVATKQDLKISMAHLMTITAASVMFSYLGSVFSLISIEYAPNPGYSLVISKSYVVFTTLVAIVLFQAELTVRKAISIAVIVVFSGLIMHHKKL